MVRDIMVANPHTAKSQLLMKKLDERLVPVPDYQKAQILAGCSILTLKQELESKLAGYKLRKTNAINAMIRYYKEELENPVTVSDSLLALFQSDNNLKSSYRLAWLYLERGEYQLGANLMSNIPNQFTLSDEEQQEHTNITGIYNITSVLFENGNPIETLSKNQVEELQILTSTGTGAAKVYARNILLTLDKMEYKEPILHPDFLMSSEAIETYNNLLAVEAPHQLSVYPNPSKGFIFLECRMETDEEGFIEITDVTGRVVHNIPIDDKQKHVTILTNDWQTGIYIATLKVNGKTLESVKYTLVN